jgi:hypothetical protein
MRPTGGYIAATEPAWTTLPRYSTGVFTLNDIEELKLRGVWEPNVIPAVGVGNAFLSTLRTDPIGADLPKFVVGTAFLSTLRTDPIGADLPKFVVGNAFLSVLRSDPI